MKKLALVLGTLATVSSVAMAKEVAPAPTVAVEPTVITKEVIREVKVQPDFRVTSVRVRVSSENKDNGAGHGKYNISDEGFIGFNANFAYKKDWTGSLEGRRYFTSETEDAGRGSYHKDNQRVYVTARRNNLELAGIKYGVEGLLEFRNEVDYYGIKLYPQFTPWLVGAYRYDYRSNSSAANADRHFIELTPGIRYAGYVATFFYEHQEAAGSFENRSRNTQLRLATPTYKVSKDLGINFGYRGTISQDTRNAAGNDSWSVRGQVDKPFDMNRIIATANYALTPTSTLGFTYFYEFGKWTTDVQKGKQKGYLNGVEAGITYRF